MSVLGWTREDMPNGRTYWTAEEEIKGRKWRFQLCDEERYPGSCEWKIWRDDDPLVTQGFSVTHMAAIWAMSTVVDQYERFDA